MWLAVSAHHASMAGSQDGCACRYNPLEEPWAAEANRGLSRFLVFLREQEELAAAAALEALKPVGTQVWGVPAWLQLPPLTQHGASSLPQRLHFRLYLGVLVPCAVACGPLVPETTLELAG